MKTAAQSRFSRLKKQNKTTQTEGGSRPQQGPLAQVPSTPDLPTVPPPTKTHWLRRSENKATTAERRSGLRPPSPSLHPLWESARTPVMATEHLPQVEAVPEVKHTY